MSEPGEVGFGYISTEQLKKAGKVDDPEILGKLADYDPKYEIVVVVILEDGISHTVIKFMPLAD